MERVRSVEVRIRRSEVPECEDKPGANEEMTAAQFREMALSFPEAVEAAHMGHPDFRVAGRIFATLGYQNEGRGVLLLSPEEQQEMISQHPKMFEPVPGGWGRHGSTQVVLARITRPVLKAAMRKAWQRKAPETIQQASASA
jgi:hypothetical protein